MSTKGASFRLGEEGWKVAFHVPGKVDQKEAEQVVPFTPRGSAVQVPDEAVVDLVKAIPNPRILGKLSLLAMGQELYNNYWYGGQQSTDDDADQL